MTTRDDGAKKSIHYAVLCAIYYLAKAYKLSFYKNLHIFYLSFSQIANNYF